MTNVYMRPWHTYAIAELREPGKWGAYCNECSQELGNYAYPCLHSNEKNPPPPRVLVEAKEEG